MPFLHLFARFVTAAGLYLIARWMFGLGSPVADAHTVHTWLWWLSEQRPRLQRQINSLLLDLWSVVGLTQIRLATLKHAIQEGGYADDRCEWRDA